MTLAADRCPLCGQANRCSQADPQRVPEPCWCFSAQIDRKALQRLPVEARGVACLCPGCARAAADAPRPPPIE